MKVAEAVQNYLSGLIGSNTARIAVKTFCPKIGRTPETLRKEDLPKLAEAIHGMLKTLCGNEKADRARQEIANL